MKLISSFFCLETTNIYIGEYDYSEKLKKKKFKRPLVKIAGLNFATKIKIHLPPTSLPEHNNQL